MSTEEESTEDEDSRLDPNPKETPSLSSPAHQESLYDFVEAAIDNYFYHLDGQEVSNVYDMVLAEVEAPLIKAVMKYTGQNQTRASVVLGMNRGTLRKKLKKWRPSRSSTKSK